LVSTALLKITLNFYFKSGASLFLQNIFPSFLHEKSAKLVKHRMLYLLFFDHSGHY